MTPQHPIKETKEKVRGFFLRYQDFKKLEEIIEGYHLDSNNEVDFNSMQADEKDILWKIKTIIRNQESVRLRNDVNYSKEGETEAFDHRTKDK